MLKLIDSKQNLVKLLFLKVKIMVKHAGGSLKQQQKSLFHL